MDYKEFVNNLFDYIAKSYDYSCKEQAEMSAAYDAYVGSLARDREATSYDFEHERDRGHTWDIGENEPHLPSMSECQSYASKELEPYLPFIKDAFDRNLDIKDIETLFHYFEDFSYTPETLSFAFKNEKNGVLNISCCMRYDFPGDKCIVANELLYKGNKYLQDVNTNDVYLRVWSVFSNVEGKMVKLGKNVDDAYKFISEYSTKELNKQINEIYIKDFISYEKNELDFFYDKKVDDSYIFSEKELEIINKGIYLDPDELSLKYRNLYDAKKRGTSYVGNNYEVEFAKLDAFVEGRELYKVSFLIPYNFHGELTHEILNHIDGSLKIVDENVMGDGDNGYAIVECLYKSLEDVAYNDLGEHKTYYLDTYFEAKNTVGETVYCGQTFGPIKAECSLTDVTKEISSRVK